MQPAQVELGPDGTPVRLDDRPVEQIRERWVVEEGWWTDAPVRRAYAELVLADGGLAVVFEDLAGGGWHRHASPTAPPGGAAAAELLARRPSVEMAILLLSTLGPGSGPAAVRGRPRATAQRSAAISRLRAATRTPPRMTTPPTHSAAETCSPSTAIAISATQNGSR